MLSPLGKSGNQLLDSHPDGRDEAASGSAEHGGINRCYGAQVLERCSVPN